MSGLNQELAEFFPNLASSSLTTKSMGKPQNCAVCGSKAACYYHEVPACNGCISFFRRTALCKRNFICENDGKCFNGTFEKGKSKRSCRACRFSKCVQLGMDPRNVNSGTLKRAPVQQTLMKTNECREMKTIDDLLYLEDKIDVFRSCAFNPNPFDFSSLEAVLEMLCCIEVAKKYAPVPYKESTPVIREFFIENDCPYEKPWFFVDVLTAIEYAKTFPFLRLLDRLDQIRLLRRVTISCYLLHYTFVGERQDLSKLLFPDGSGLHAPPERFELAFRKVCKGVVNLATTMIKARVDVREYVLLKAIVLCNPAVSDLSPSAQKLLTEERARYGQTLFDYCMVQRGVTEGPSRFAALLNILEQLEQLAQKDKDFYVLLAASPHDDFILPYPKGHTSNRLMLEVMDV